MIPRLFSPAISDALTAAGDRGLRVLLVGALARDLCLPPESRGETRKTDDADLALMVDDWATFDGFLDACDPQFDVNRAELRMRHKQTGIPVDVAPCGALEDPPGRLALRKSSRVLNVVGVVDAFESATPVRVGTQQLLVPAPAAFVILKLLSFHDRRAHRDLRDLGYVCRRSPVDEGAIFSDAALMTGFARGSLLESDLPTWQLGRAIATGFSSEVREAFGHGLKVLENEKPLIRTQLMIEDGRALVDPDRRVASADRLIRVLITALAGQAP